MRHFFAVAAVCRLGSEPMPEEGSTPLPRTVEDNMLEDDIELRHRHVMPMALISYALGTFCLVGMLIDAEHLWQLGGWVGLQLAAEYMLPAMFVGFMASKLKGIV